MVARSIVSHWAVAFAITITAEAPVVWWGFRLLEPRAVRRWALVLFANLATHPAACLLFPTLVPHLLGAFLVAELWAWLVEAAVFKLVLPAATWERCLAASLVANLASVCLGALSSGLTGWP